MRKTAKWLHDHQDAIAMFMIFPVTIAVATYFLIMILGNVFEHWVHKGVCPGCGKARGKWDWGDTNPWDGTQRAHWYCRDI